MADTIKVASRSPMAIRITESAEGKEPGTELKSAVLSGSSSIRGSLEGVTEVDAAFFRQWLKANPDHPAVAAGLIREMDEDEDIASADKFGFEPALKAAVDDKDNSKAAAKGSTVTDGGPVKSSDLATRSDTPNDDSPRSQTTVVPVSAAPVVTQPITPAAPPAPVKK